jgi:uncharacterized protein YbjT (DUF2867 family)
MGKRGGRKRTEPRDERGLTGDLSASTGTMMDWVTEKVVRKTKVPSAVLPDPAQAVARGAAWLDVMSPRTLLRMDEDTVDVQSIAFCPLSNAFPRFDGSPDFAAGVRQLCRPARFIERVSSLLQGDGHRDSFGRLVPQRPSLPNWKGSDTQTLSLYGFAPHPLDPHPDPYGLLNALWADEIRKRKAARS